MPLTDIQRRVFGVIKGTRSPESYVFGAVVLHAGEKSPRYSKDIDICHDIAESVTRSAESDVTALGAAGFAVEWKTRLPTFQRAEVRSEGEVVLLDWAFDSAFRFFPVEEDEELGYRLHRFDVATNKLLALAGRSEPRDFVDAIYIDANYLTLGTLAWAAAGKDGGLNPAMILELAGRFAHYRQEEIDELDLTEPLILADLAERWRAALDAARALVRTLPTTEIGCAYCDENGEVVDAGTVGAVPHFGSVGGAWPMLGRVS